MSSFDRILNEIDASLASMRANLERGEMLLEGLGEWRMTEEETNFFEEMRVSTEDDRSWSPPADMEIENNQVRWLTPLEYHIEDGFPIDDDGDDDGSRRLSFSSDTSSSTVIYFTPFSYHQYNSTYFGYESESDSSTVVDEWEEPWNSPSGL